MRRSLVFLLPICFGACISIGTYEKQMAKCREAQKRADVLEKEVQNLEGENDKLQSRLTDESFKQMELQEKIVSVRSTYDELLQELQDDISAGDVGVSTAGDDLTISMGNKVLFASGASELQPRGVRILAQVAKILKKVNDHIVKVEGHTDNVPISGPLKARFPTNWDLSAARSAAVVRCLDQQGVDPKKLMVVAFGQNKPVKPNSTPAGRQENRRVEISLVKIRAEKVH